MASKKIIWTDKANIERKEILEYWTKKKELWYFSIVDIVAVLADSLNPQVYWRVLKKD